MIQDTLFISIAVAGMAILWRNLIYDNENLRGALKKLPKRINHALTCGFCFTLWLALVSVIIFDPLHGWMPPFRIEIFAVVSTLSLLGSLFQILFSWMIVGTIAAAIRFCYVAVQEFVHYEVHHLNHREH